MKYNRMQQNSETIYRKMPHDLINKDYKEDEVLQRNRILGMKEKRATNFISNGIEHVFQDIPASNIAFHNPVSKSISVQDGQLLFSGCMRLDS